MTTIPPIDIRTMRRGPRVAFLAVRILLVLAFFLAGGLKIYGLPRLVVEFQHIGLGDWFRYLTALLEIGGAAALMIPGLIGIGAALLACVMLGAIATHVFILGDSAIAALALFVLCVTVLAAHRHELASLLQWTRHRTDNGRRDA